MTPEPFDPDQTLRAMSVGQRVLGQRYTLLRVVGRGGMGVVWLAHDETLNDEVALKVLPEQVIHDVSAIHDLKHETQRSLKLTHPNIVRIHGFLEDGESAAISMEYVDGATLARRRIEQPGAVFSPVQVLPYLRQITEALDYAHNRAKIVHRDIKPTNLLISKNGEVKIADFGISATLTDTATRLSRRDSGSSGSPPYMSPQQMMGEKPSVSDDIYALGATVYELLTGKPPFHTGNLLMQVQGKVAPSLQERRAELLGTAADDLPPIPANWEKTIAACLAKDPAERPSSVRKMLEDLESRVASAPLTPPPPTVPSPPPPPPTPTQSAPALPIHPQHVRSPAKPQGWLWPVMAVLLLALGAIAFFAFRPGKAIPAAPLVQKHQEPTPPTAPTPASEAVPAKPQHPAPAVAAAFIITVDPVIPKTRLQLGREAELTINDGRARLQNLSPGEQDLSVHAPGHQPYITRVTVAANGGGEALVKLVPIRGTVELSARPGTVVTARDAAGFNHLLGTTGADGKLNTKNSLGVGAYTFRFEHPALTTLDVPGELQADRPLMLHVDQTPHPGELRISTSPSGASIIVNGQAAGQTPATLRDQPSEVPLIISLRLSGYRSIEQSVTLEPKEIRTLNVPALARETGSLRPEVTPVDAAAGLTFSVDGKSTASDGGELRDLETGKHIVVATHPDYKPWITEVEVRNGETTLVPMSLVPKRGTLAIATTPAGATVRITGVGMKNSSLKAPDGQASLTPFKATLPPGDYTLGLALADHEAAECKVTVTADREQNISVAMIPIPRLGALSLQITPNAAVSDLTLLLDGKAATTEAGELRNLSAGRHTIAATHPDYAPWSTEAEVKEGETTSLLIPLSPKPGRLTFITSPAGANVRALGGDSKTTTWKDTSGRESLTPFIGTLVPGSYNLTFSLAGHQTVEHRVSVMPNGEQTVRVDLGANLKSASAPATRGAPETAAPATGILRIWGAPAISGILYKVDGQPVVPISGELRNLSAGSHRIEVSHPAYTSWTGVVDVKAGDTTNLQVTLSPKDSTSVEDLIRNRRRSSH